VRILALLVAIWQVPLLLPQFGGSPLEFLATFAVTFWYWWLFNLNRIGGSVLITIVAHSTQGSIQTSALWAADAAAGDLA
jgi:hypothetical protein